MTDSMRELSQLANKLKDAQNEVDQCELELKRAETKRDFLREEKIPELMLELGFDEFKTTSGLKIEIKDKMVYCEISEKNKPTTYAWMDDNGHGGMIKRTITVSFDRDQEEKARELQESLREDYPGVRERGEIHWQTLQKWVKDRLKEGEAIPGGISYELKKVAKIN